MATRGYLQKLQNGTTVYIPANVRVQSTDALPCGEWRFDGSTLWHGTA